MSTFDWNSSRLVVSCAGGLETFLLQEIQAVAGPEYTLVRGAVEGPASLKNVYEICLRSRIASRLLLPIAEFPYKNEDDFYHRLRQVHWQAHFSLQNSVAISTSKEASVNVNTQFLTYRTKDAIMDYFRHFQRDRPNVDTRNPDMRIHVHFGRELVQVALDLSGEPLHKRGYRVAQNEAPLKETLAAALLMSAGWPNAEYPRLVDPMCGSGTLLIEAAMMQSGMVPGLLRKRFGFEKWAYHDEGQWQQAVHQVAQEDRSEDFSFQIKGYDADNASIQAAMKNIAAAGLEGCIHVERRELAQFALHQNPEEPLGMVVCNPPYGERLDKDADLIFLYRAIARRLQENCEHWRAALITNNVEFADALQLDHPETLRVYNGAIRCVIRSGDVVKRASHQCVPEKPELQHDYVESAPAKDLLNRIKKNLKGLQKWIEREQVLAYRLYDADIPEYNMAIDWYNGHLHVQEYAPPKSVSPEKAEQRLQDALDSLKAFFALPHSRLHVKSRQRQKGKQQYQKLGESKRMLPMDEAGALILVNLDDYLDTGLFLDHRPTRIRLQELAKNTRFLNLFCYTAAATVHAAIGGAKRTTSVDMSATYLNWARNNLYLNGCSESHHQLVRSDCMAWLKQCHDQFDLIFVDPPTFSNSKRMQGYFDVQKSQVELLDLAMKRLEPGGLLIFSNNFNRFELEPELMERYDVTDVTQASLPPDFARGKPIHRCWEFRHK
ncbi:bifunctional 23S rRNA (guanine(2069)-N(7))-methyltransferase RlmK/23S rRNA (guanine(2445)-N(2))-methyltransferase RlmL [Ketobacter sp.]|uniref:bifunctional 23S rRNA (guanine(2069)-N(7))-methyltransferase RlmK/23S rRNA (guanine(2445)-N(2))-methyltransferase RlmL n=1 Tax=Ketobacter sp. TaxID=2083498 RepID=UPI000F1E0A5D|nr:bifunctional 23S rRNA (guanine(2069)-N(7))-methyltransferase RlmK/23S rRNA (guanine(2445)-N(2))-methyltransferase RlmL [Ketobacter sp.]RLT93503.1 MAG: bifunctional 23S rRNA (guanine(2069)-N(7))-methyltransferase RlmK/23S rRNA (guanine(2445)-N(2))-methyltransferase RlmL [Ketobacter sp.]